MIKVTIVKENSFKELEVKGHANQAEYGKDLVCAAVSAVTVGGLNNLHEPENFEIKIEEGYVLARAIKEISHHDEVVLETIITSLKCIAEDNSKYIAIIEK